MNKQICIKHFTVRFKDESDKTFGLKTIVVEANGKISHNAFIIFCVKAEVCAKVCIP